MHLKMKTYSRRSNLKFCGIDEKYKETDMDCETAVRKLVQDYQEIDHFSIEKIHRRSR